MDWIQKLFRNAEQTVPPKEVPPGTNMDSLSTAFKCGESQSATTRGQGIDTYRNVAQRDPECGMAWFNLGVLHSRNGEVNEAVECFQRAQDFTEFRAVAAYAWLALLIEKGEIRDVASFQRLAEPKLPQEFRGTGGSVLGVHGRCYNAANEMNRRGYACEVHCEGLHGSIKISTPDAEYEIRLRDIYNTLTQTVFRTSHKETAQLNQHNLSSAADRELYWLNLASMPIAQAPVQSGAATPAPQASVSAGDEGGTVARWRRTGPSFADQYGTPEPSTLEIAKNLLSPERAFLCVLAREPHAIAMPQVAKAEIPLLRESIEKGGCVLRGQLFRMATYPIIHIGLAVPAVRLQSGAVASLLMESIANCCEGNLQEWVSAVQAKRYTMVDVLAPDYRAVAMGRMAVGDNVIAEIVAAMDDAHTFLAGRWSTLREGAFDQAVDAFYKEHPQPFLAQ